MRFRAGLGWFAAAIVLVGSGGCSSAYDTAPPASVPAPSFHDIEAGIGLTPPTGWTLQPRPDTASHGYIAGFVNPTVPEAGLIVIGGKAEPIDQLIGEILTGFHQQRPDLRDIGREPVTSAGGRAATLATVGAADGPEALLLVVPNGDVDFVVFAHVAPEVFAAQSPALRSALVSFTVDRATSVDWAGIAIGVAAGLIWMGVAFGVMTAIWFGTPNRRWADLPGGIWITPPVIAAGVAGHAMTTGGASEAAFEDCCGLWLVVSVIGVIVRWANRRHSSPTEG